MNTLKSRSLGPIKLTPPITPGNALTFLYAAFIGITLNTFVNFIQPFVLTEQLLIPEQQQGAMTGNLVFFSELVLLVACGVAGLLADRLGRRFVFVAGFLVLSFGFAIYGLVDSYSELLLLRLFIALGVACINVMVTTVQADYPQEQSRGKLVGLTGVFIGLGALFLVLVLSKLPLWYSAVASPRTAGLYTLLTTAAIALFSALILWRGLSSHNPHGPGPGESAQGWKKRLSQSLYAARENPRVGLSYACAFVARSDLIVVGVFFSLWLTQAAVAAGMPTADAIKTAGIYFGIVQVAALLSAPLLGYLNDRVDRLSSLVIALFMAAIGYGAMGIIENPLGSSMLPAAILLGIGQMSVMLASQTLIGQEAPVPIRGAVMGMFSVCGALGIMFITKLGGEAFDHWKPAPFVMVAVLNIVLCLVALKLRFTERQGARQQS